MTQASAIPVVIDEPELMARLGGRRDLLAMLASIFARDLPSVRAEFAAALAAGDAAQVRRVAHRVVGTVADLSAPALIEYGRDIEELAVRGDLAATGPRIPVFLAALDELDARLRQLVDAPST